MEDKKGAYFLVAVFALSLRSVSGGCEQNALGLADGYILDSELTASSVLNSNTPAKNGRLNYTAGSSWCASTSDSNPYLQINLQTLYIICAVSTQGNSQADQWVKNYTLQSSTDGATWTDYKEDGQTKVFLGNFGANSTAKRALFSELSTKYLRVVARDNHGGVCMRIELYGHHIQGNIALFMPTSQSTTLETAIASRAVDGVKNSDHSYCTHTQGSGSSNPWWRVDLGRVQLVSSVRILNRGDCCAERLDGAEIRVGNDAANGGASNHRCANITQIPAGQQQTYDCTPTAQGRYVSIRIPGNSKILTVCEVEVYSFLTRNLAFKQPTEQNSTDAGGVASRAVDGNNSPVWADNSCTHTTTTTDPWWRVDLGFSVAVAEVRIFNRACTGDCGSRLSSFEIRIGNVRENNGGTSNSQCGNLHSIANGKSKSIYCVPRIVGRYVYIRIPGNNKVLTLCEVEVYSRRRVDGNACNNQPVGLEDSSKIPDYRFTASSNGVNKSPSSGRLKGSVAWVPSTTNADDFLQIDLGSVYAVCSVATQGSPNADNWTTMYKMKTSLDNSNWTTYAENNADKVFDGNNDKISIIRNDLLHPTFAKFIRFYPMAFSGHRALRVEVYGSPEGCQSPLGLEDRHIQYSQISASSKVDPNNAANFSRLYSSSSWCSSAASSSEYLQVDLGQVTAITGIATQGDSSVDKWVTRYMVQFGAHSYTRLFRYLSFQGNRNRNLPYVNWFSEPVETSVVRIVPLSWKTSVCLRLELYGCGLLLKVPKPTINNFQDVNLQPAKGSFVNLQCNASSGVDGMMIVFRWAKDGNDISTLSTAVSTQGKFFLSTLRVNFTKAEDIVSSYNCTRESVVSRTVDCQKTFVCLAFYSSLALGLEPTYQTAVVTVKLRVPDGVKQITVDTILGTSAVIRWQKLLAGGADEAVIAGYQVWYAKESNPNPANFVNATKNDTLVLDNLTRNTRYMVKVRAISALGFGLWSSTVNFRTARTVTCEEKILGPETGLTPDMVMSSSQYNSSTSSSHSVMSYAVDFPWCASHNDTSPYLEIDLGDVFVICALSTQGEPHGEYWVEFFTLETSADGTTWTDYKEEDQQRTFLGNYDSATVVKQELYSGMVCQKVRLRVKAFHGLPCLKLQLFGVKQSRGNLALNQPTNQTDTNAGGVASRAVDGGTSTDYTQGSCTHTTTTNSPWWRVDLGFSVAVAEVRIVNRACTGGCGSRLSSFEIKIGNSTSGGGSSNQLCRDNLKVLSGQTNSFFCDPPIYGRYVYIRIPGGGKTLTLCEVEVYSTPRKNLALNKQTTQSSTNSGGDSPRAVDGNPSTDWGQSSCTHTNTESNPWWRVDLGSAFVVGEVFVVNRDCGGGCGERLKGFQIWIGDVDENGGTSNTKCGNLHSIDRGKSKSIYCVPRILGRFVYIRIPGNNKVLTLCEVEVYSTRRVDGDAVCDTQPVGAADSFKIPDHRFSASSSKAGNEPYKGRLNGGSAWIPSTNGNNNDFLEVDLGSVYFVCGVVTQGNPSPNEWTTEFKIKTSLNNKNWTTYGENGIEKVFAGNTDRSSLRRNSLIRAPLAKFIRFYPVTYSASKALRVEIYGYAQGSKTPLGLENGDLTDSQLAASSNLAAVKNGRLYNQSAWCSSAASPTEYFQVDLGNVKTITGVATQGDPSHDRWVETYTVNYSYTGQHWTQFKGVSKQPELFKGNHNRNSVQANWMKQPFVARYLRIFAQTWNSGICLRIDGYGSALVNAPIIRPPLIDKTLKKTVGNSVILSCVVYGRAHVSVTWMVNGQELTNPSDITSNIVLGNNWEKTESNLTFTYRNANYGKTLFQCTRVSRETRILRCKKLSVTCKANYYGTLLGSSSAASVSLVDNLFLPESPTQPVFSNIKSTSAVVAWNDTDSGDSPILFYRVLYNTSSLSMNQTTLTRSINITSLQPYTDYTFKVQAISAIGDGLVSKAAHLKTYLRASIFLPPPKVYRLTLGQRNVSFVCFGQGYPIPKVLWKKDGNLIVLPTVSSIVSAINSSKRLEISGNGATYQEAGNYTCEVNNGVDGMPVVSSTLEIIFSPEFTITPKDATVIEEKSEVFDCRATGIPTPVISWSFNGTGRLPSTSSQLSNGSLLITRVQNNINYEGTYTCSASSRAGESTAEANLTVWVVPSILSPLENVTLLRGSKLNLTCLADGDPLPSIYWSKNGSPTIPRSHFSQGNSTLVIPSVTIPDEGLYECTARSRAGNNSSEAHVEVQVKPNVFVSGNKTVILEKGQKDVIVKCFGNGYPAPTVRWRKWSNVIPVVLKQQNDSVVQVVSTDIQNPMDNVTSDLYLLIGGVTYNESGNFTCTADNGVGDNPAASSVEVIFKPEFVIKPQSKIVKEGATVFFMCKASGVPQPEVSWSLKNGSLPPHSTDLNGNLTIPSVGNNNTYERTYTCTAMSRAGVATIDVVLTVHVPPRIVLALNKSVVAERGDTVRLSCSAVGDPTPRYQWTKDRSPVIPNAVLENNNTTLQLTNVDSRNDGIYTCLAVNDAGDVSTSSNVTVHARPSILDIFSNTETIENNVLNLSCTGVSIPAPDVTWYKHNKPVTSSQHILITTTGKLTRITTLSIQRVKYEDRGDYTCSFANYRGSINRTGSLIVLVPSNISIPPTSVNEKLGLRVSFNCTVRGFPLPTLLWTKDNINLNISNGIEIAQHEDSSKIESFTSLTVIQAKRSDTGVYVCHANNSAGTTSKAANLTVLEKPDKLRATIDFITAHTVKLSWRVSFDGNSPVLFYTTAHNISNGTMSYNVSSNESSLVMNLNPATFYEFTITATNQFGTSDPVLISTTTLESVPEAPRFVTTTVTGSRSIFLDWTIPAITNGKLINYVVYYNTTEDYGDNTAVPMNQTLLPNTTSLVIESLVPFTYYTFQVQAFTKVGGGHRSDPTERVRTHQDVPGAPSDITVEEQGEERFVIRWKKPSEENGIITGYKLYFVVRRNNADDTETVEDRVCVINGDYTTKLIRVYELNGHKTYDVIVQARTSEGYGQNSTETATVKTRPIRPPPPPPPQPPNETTTETAVIELAEFSDINGPIVYYQVINLRVPQTEPDNFPTPEEITPNKLVSYEEAHTSNKPAPYVAFGFEGDEFNRHKRFKLGNGQTCCLRKKRDIAKTYNNGPLEPNTIYKAFTRAFTSESEYSQSQYIPIRTKELPTPPTPPQPGSPIPIIAGAIVGVLLIVFAAIVFIYIRRKRRTRDDHADENELQPLGRLPQRAGRQSFDNEGFKSDIDGNRRPIPVQNLKEYYFRMHEDDNRLFTEEYKSLKITGSPTTQICDRPDNKVRNRYGNIKAYDHSRVILTMGGSSDYINANYIDGYVRPKQYIATIGPKPETVNHFWWMIWQEKTSIIVMLTRPVEQGKVKCHQYWPDSGGEEYGALTVTVKEKLEYSEFEIRTLSLQMPTKPDLEPRIVKHFYFTAWPDHDVPDEATGLLQFWKAVKKCASGIEEPIVVHCSAGVGRTGTFITIDAMMEQISASEELDVYSFVTRMREQRNFMVQRQSQYNFIFYALLEATTFGDTEILGHNLRMKMQKMTAKNPKTGKTSFEREFELLDGVVPQENSDFKSALKSVNTKKNRYANVLPYEKSRVLLPKTSEEEEDDTSYINASYIEGHQQKKAYIATQAPLRNTVGDFWRMVWDKEVCCIVMLITVKEDSEVPFVDYWSEVEAIMHGSLSIETTDFDNKENYAVRKINLSDTKTEKVRKVTQYTVSNWPKDGIPSDPMAVVNMIGAVQKTQQQTGNNPIVVHCSDGIGRTGTFCAIVTSLEHIKLEDSVDVFTTVRMLRTQRPGMVQTLEQYKFIYDALMAYLDSFEASLYQNFL